MPKVKFLLDFQGRETREVFYRKGTVVDLPDHMADPLVAQGFAEFVIEVRVPVYFIDESPEPMPVRKQPKEEPVAPVARPRRKAGKK